MPWTPYSPDLSNTELPRRVYRRGQIRTNRQELIQRNKCKWDENSKHWRYRLGKLCELREKSPEKLVQGLKQIVMCTDDEFRIGAGSFGTTVYAALMTDGREVAVKELLKTGRQGKTSIQKEVDILVKLRPHDNILSYKLTEWPEGHVGYIVTELCEFTLNVWLQEDQVTRLSDEEWNREVPGLLKDLLSGLNHLHSHDPLILHRDIKNLDIEYHVITLHDQDLSQVPRLNAVKLFGVPPIECVRFG
ncbi:hypothetical protein LSAT2_003973 [Lamellibrachia satsuma]|nr:hypothetical protein LSAT2_003973 [Lamellibrachia satsuma]